MVLKISLSAHLHWVSKGTIIEGGSMSNQVETQSGSVISAHLKPLMDVVRLEPEIGLKGIVGERLTLPAFFQLSGNLAGYPFVKLVVDRSDSGKPVIHFINHAKYQFHSDYIAEVILKTSIAEVEKDIDAFNYQVYLSPDRKFFLGILAYHTSKSQHSAGERFFSLETVEIDTMDASMVKSFYSWVKDFVDPTVPLLFKPANHLQEAISSKIDPAELPRVFSHELFSSSQFIALNSGIARGRLRSFKTEAAYRAEMSTLEWYDILVMHRVPDDIPRIAGMINAHHTTPLSHTNVLANGWRIPNSIQLGIFNRIGKEGLEGQWVQYKVDSTLSQVDLTPIARPKEIDQRPAWSIQRIKLEEPETAHTPIVDLDCLRMSDRYRYGTKAANLGELRFILENGSERLLGFYKIRRPPRPNLLPYLAKLFRMPESVGPPVLARAAWDFLRSTLQIPKGIALPFSVQQEFLESSPRIQQALGKLKMALELNAREVDSICLNLQTMIRTARMPDRLRNYIDSQIANHLGGVSSFVVRSSSNAEDLENFSAAGIYESINHVTTAENIFQSIKEVWASLLSPRSVRLRQEVGISLDDSYMGVIIQEEIRHEETCKEMSGEPNSQMGGVLVTANPVNREGDFRNVFINASTHSVGHIVQGCELPYQYLFNTVEGGGRTLSIGNATEDLSESQKRVLQKLALAGRLLQSHFSPNYTFSSPVDIEWLANAQGIFILQLRPFTQ
jgi:hypothetical protein